MDERVKDAAMVFPTSDGANALGSAASPIHISVDASNVGGDMTVTGDIAVDGNADVGGDLGVTGTASVTSDADVGGDLAVTGDIAAAGGFKVPVGPFYVTTAASQSAVGTKLGDTAGQTWVAPFPGSILAHSGMVDAAVTGASKSIKARVYKNGSLVHASLDLDFTQVGAETTDYATAAKDTYAFVAGDQIKVVYTTDAITNTPKLTTFLMVEC